MVMAWVIFDSKRKDREQMKLPDLTTCGTFVYYLYIDKQRSPLSGDPVPVACDDVARASVSPAEQPG